MSPDEQEASELIRSGRYFDQARQWYTTLYIGPISERSVFLALGILAGLVGIFGFFALTGLMPITERPPLMIGNPRLNDAIPQISRLRAGDQNVNRALLEFYLTGYVQSRYDTRHYQKKYLFVRAHSAPQALDVFEAEYSDPQNQHSPRVVLAKGGQQNTIIDSLDIDSGSPAKATIDFRLDTEFEGITTTSRWTATFNYYYSDAVVSEETDPKSGERAAKVQEPEFQVVNYALTKLP